jgi:hypothetical protein
VKFEALVVMSIKMAVLWDITSSSLVDSKLDSSDSIVSGHRLDDKAIEV